MKKGRIYEHIIKGAIDGMINLLTLSHNSGSNNNLGGTRFLVFVWTAHTFMA